MSLQRRGNDAIASRIMNFFFFGKYCGVVGCGRELLVRLNEYLERKYSDLLHSANYKGLSHVRLH